MAVTTPEHRTFDFTNIEIEPSSRGARSRIAAGPIWAGFAIGLATWLLLELILFAADLTGIDVGVGNADTSSWWWSGVAAIVAFFIGGFVAGMTTVSRASTTGLMEGAVVWAIGFLAAVLLTSAGFGAGLGALGDVFGFEQALQDASGGGGVSIAEDTVEDFREVAGWAALFVALTLAAALLGGATGAKAKARDDREIDLADRRGDGR